MEKISTQQSKLTTWLLATRPRTLPIGAAPVVLGSGLAYSLNRQIDWSFSVITLFCALSIQIATNLINDALDFKKGTDTKTRLGPLRAAQSGLIPMEQVLNGGYIALGLAFLLGVPLVIQGGVPLLLLLISSLACAYLYTGGPYPLAYVGLGDLFGFLFFGLACTVATYYLQTGDVDFRAFLGGSQLGLLVVIPIAINNLRDHVDDAKVNKQTLVVRFGKRFARLEITCLTFVPYLLNLLWLSYGFTMAALLPLFSLPMAYKLVLNIWKHEPDRIYNEYLAQSAKLNIIFACLLILGLLA